MEILCIDSKNIVSGFELVKKGEDFPEFKNVRKKFEYWSQMQMLIDSP